MTSAFKPYPDYRDSGLPWLGKVPRHWDVLKIGQLFSERRCKVSDSEYPPLSVCKAGVVPQLADVALTNDGENRKQVLKEDFVINSRSDRKGSSGLSAYDGSVSLINIVLAPRDGLNGKFAHHLMRSHIFVEEYYRNGRGIVADLWTTRFSEMKSIVLPVPPREEQDRIVRFLDSQVAKINRLVKIKKRQIALLQELKQATINRAVTRGLDPSVPLVESGVEEIGKIPKGWTVCPLKSVADSNLRSLQEDESPDFQFKYLDIGSVGFNEIKTDPCVMTFAEAPSRARRKVNVGDTIISTVRTYLKSLAYISESLDGIIVSTGFSVLTPKTSTNPELLHYLLAADYFIVSVIKNSLGISYPAINDTRLMSLSVIVPDKGSQHKILEYLQHECVKYDRLIENEKLLIDKLVEYRTRLIADVVTGKLDVRGVAVSDEAGLGGDTATEDDDEEAGESEGDPEDAAARLEVAE
ncbi:MAG: restriction endonuclease subunit S [Synergistaceae bacterium]|nr:restriction endonuclease subunit S [Synergistaceae bacterium]